MPRTPSRDERIGHDAAQTPQPAVGAKCHASHKREQQTVASQWPDASAYPADQAALTELP